MITITLDTELGGIELKYSLLQAYFAALDENFTIVSELNLYLKPNDGDYIVCGQALGVNHIDLFKHDAIAITYDKARTALGTWLRTLYDNHPQRFRAMGHGVAGDLRHIWDKIYARQKWENYVSYRTIDTSSVCQYLKDIGKLPQSDEALSGGLESLVKYFNIPHTADSLHDAKVDALLTAKVYQRMLLL